MSARPILLALAAILGLSPPASAETADTSTLVVTPSGRLRGVSEGGVAEFRGIPYARPPLGDLRWRAPQPVRAWSGIRDASAFAHDCMQTPFPGGQAPLRTTPDEDCLYLNVWKPEKARPGARLPVLVWFYGGAFVTGGTSPAIYDGSAFARQDVIFVSFNYRLGRFGFFGHPELTREQGPVGNFAVMDQIAALRWVRDNIAAFGGDPAKVTLIGESAGGTSVISMLTVPSARGLYRGAIVMSGGGRTLMRAASLAKAEKVGVNFAHKEGIEGSGPKALAALRALPASQVQGPNLFADLVADPQTYLGGYVTQDKVAPETCDAVIARGEMAPVPIMIGRTSADSGITRATDKDALFASFGAQANALRALYDPDASASFASVRGALLADQYMGEPARFVARHAEALGQKAYVYTFGYVAQSQRQAWPAGAPHASDIPYFFDTVEARYTDKTKPLDKKAAVLANAYVVNFVRTGDPNGPGLPSWPAYHRGEEEQLAFDTAGGAKARKEPSQARLDALEKAAPIPGAQSR